MSRTFGMRSEHDLLVREQGRGENRESGVLGAADVDHTFEEGAPLQWRTCP